MKILIIGGTGITGSLVREQLSDTEWLIDYCSRHAVDDPRHRILDLSGPRESVLALLRGYDWVVACVGPFEKWMDKVAVMCVEAGVNYLDINDSIDAREAILRSSARSAGIKVVTGAGLCPGLSTALLMGKAGEPVKSIRVFLRIGGGQPAGAASVLSMFSTMYGGYRILRNGEVQTIPHSLTSDEFTGYECPDIGIVRSLFPNIQNYSYYVGFTALDPKTVRALQTKRLFSLPLISGWLAKKAAAGVTGKAREQNDPKPTTLEVIIETESVKTSVALSGLTSYQFTALAAVTCLRFFVTQSLPPGSYEIAQVPELRSLLLKACSDYGVIMTQSEKQFDVE